MAGGEDRKGLRPSSEVGQQRAPPGAQALRSPQPSPQFSGYTVGFWVRQWVWGKPVSLPPEWLLVRNRLTPGVLAHCPRHITFSLSPELR